MTASHLASFISSRLAPHLGSEASLPRQTTADLVILFADISGFTPLAEHLANQGESGAEQLSAMLNAYFGRLVDIIESWGGDVFTFAGDALMAFWPLASEGALRAAACGLDIQEQLNHYRVADGLFLSLHLGLAAGPVEELLVGGVGGRIELLITGAPLLQMAQAEHHSTPGTVVLSPAALEAAGSGVVTVPLSDGFARVAAARAQKPEAREPRVAGATVEAMQPCVPRAVAERIQAGQTEWLAEIRRVTVLFFHLHVVEHVSRLDALHATVQEAQRVLERLEVTADQWLVDDKGTILLAAAGLPPWTHEDDAERGLRAGLDLVHAAHHHGFTASVGITTGRVFCGPVGNGIRRRYTILGDVVNLAARLMQNAAGQVLCDTATAHAVGPGHFTFEPLPALQVKGKAEPVAAYRPHHGGSPLAPAARPTLLVGRDHELQQFGAACDRLVQGSGGVMLVTGEAGLGKTRFLEAAHAVAVERGLRVLVGHAQALTETTAWHVWHDVFAALFPDPDVRLSAMQAAAPSMHDLVPLMRSILPLEAPDLALSGRVRAENVHRVATALLNWAAAQTPLVIVLEGGHHFDSASWELVQEVAAQVPACLLLVSLRPLEPPLPQPLVRLQSTAVWVRLEAPSDDELAHIAAQRLGATRLSPALAAFVCERAAGNPLFAQEFVAALHEQDWLVHQGARLDWKSQAPHDTPFPATMMGLMLGRIDRLHAEVQLTLKTASVIGTRFDAPLLRDVHPLDVDRAHLPAHLAELVTRSLVAVSSPTRYTFNHGHTWEAAYNLLLVSQRQALHRAVALRLEQDGAIESASECAALARHWSHTATPDKALPYCVRAGDLALQAGAFEEAVYFLELAETLDPAPEHGPLSLCLPYARRHRCLGQALHGLDRMGESRVHLERALALMEHPLPSLSRAILGSVEEAAIQLEHRLVHLPGSLSPEAAEVALETARVYELLLEIFFLSNDTALSLYGMVRALNLTEAVAPSPELARAYACAAAVMGFMRLLKPSRYYGERAVEVAKAVGDRPAEAYAIFFVGYTAVCRGELVTAASTFEQAAALALDVGDRGTWQKAVMLLGLVAWHQGHLDATLEYYRTVLDYVERKMRTEHRAWALIGPAQVALRRGDMETAMDLMLEARRLVGGAHDRRTGVPTGGILALSCLRLGRQDEAVQHAADTSRQLAANPAGDLGALPGHVGVVETYLRLWQETGTAWERPARAAVAALRRYASVIALASPYASVAQARVDALRGRAGTARRHGHRAWDEAREAGMPWEEGLAARLLSFYAPEEWLPREHDAWHRAGAVETRGHTAVIPH